MYAKLALMLSVWSCAMAAADEIPKGEKVEFKIYTRPYFEKNNSGLKGDSSALLISDQEKFDSIFGIGFVMGKKPDLIAKDAWDKQAIVAVIRRGDSVVKYTVKGVTTTDGTLYVDYTAEKDPPTTAKFASPLLIAVPKAPYKAIVFVENGKKSATIEVGK